MNTKARYGMYRNVKIKMEKAHGDKSYDIIAIYKGIAIKAHTTDNKIWNNLENAEDPLMFNEARKHCYDKIVDAYKKEVFN